MLDNWSIIESERCFDENDSFNAYEWSWWDEWKERVFYAVDDDYTPNTIYFWVKAVKKSTETQAEFNLRKQTLTTNTFAKITDPTKSPVDVLPTDWNLESIPSAGLQTLQLNDDSTVKNASFLILVAGRELKTTKIEQIRSSTADKKIVQNYLERENTPPDDRLFKRKSIFNDFDFYDCLSNCFNSSDFNDCTKQCPRDFKDCSNDSDFNNCLIGCSNSDCKKDCFKDWCIFNDIVCRNSNNDCGLLY
jgi:hypothetical protein